MLITVPNKAKYEHLKEGDIIALTENDRFLGYATVYSKASDTLILDADKKIWQTLFMLISEDIPFSFDIGY